MPNLSRFTYPKRLPGRCAINTETSAVKQPAGATPNQAWQRCSFFFEARQPQKSTEGKEVRVVAAIARGLMVLGSLCSSAADRLISFSFHGGGRQAMRRSPNPRRCGSVTHPPCHFHKGCEDDESAAHKGPRCRRSARLSCTQQVTERYRPGPQFSIAGRASAPVCLIRTLRRCNSGPCNQSTRW